MHRVSRFDAQFYSDLPDPILPSLAPEVPCIGIDGLLQVIKEQNLEKVQSFFQAGNVVNLRYSEKGHTPLMYAVCHTNSNVPMAQLLIEARGPQGEFVTDLNANTHLGTTSLMFATALSLIKMIPLLLDARTEQGERRIHVNACTKTQTTAIMIAAYHGRDDIVDILMRAGADANGCSKGGWSVLMHALYSRNIKVVQLLIQAQDTAGRYLVNLSACSQSDDTALNIALDIRFKEAAFLLIQARDQAGRLRIDLNKTNRHDVSALMLANHMMYGDIADKLLQAGADAQARKANVVGTAKIMLRTAKSAKACVVCHLPQAYDDIYEYFDMPAVQTRNEHNAQSLAQAQSYATTNHQMGNKEPIDDGQALESKHNAVEETPVLPNAQYKKRAKTAPVRRISKKPHVHEI